MATVDRIGPDVTLGLLLNKSKVCDRPMSITAGPLSAQTLKYQADLGWLSSGTAGCPHDWPLFKPLFLLHN